MAINGEPMITARDQKARTKKCHLLGSNQGPSDLQSDALPTELKRLVGCLPWIPGTPGVPGAKYESAKSTSSGDRTHDHKIKSLALYHLSYGGIGDVGWVCIERGGISSIGRVRR